MRLPGNRDRVFVGGGAGYGLMAVWRVVRVRGGPIMGWVGLGEDICSFGFLIGPKLVEWEGTL